MSATASCELTFEPDVSEFLKRHGAETDFDRMCELVRSCFPEVRAIRVRLLEDPDEENHTWVGLHVFVPRSHPTELLRTQRLRYYEQLRDLPPRSYHPLSFALTIQFTPE